jgi:hypothetical protein
VKARHLFGLLLIACLAHAQPQPRPIKRPIDNGLDAVLVEAPQRAEPPAAITGITERLVFHVSPLSAKGLLSQQVRDALKALDKANGGATMLKLRAFVAGTGDIRRVQAIVVEEFEDKKWPLPAITTIQVGALPLEGAQVVIESVSQERSKQVNPGGLAFFTARSAASGAEAVASLDSAMQRTTAAALSITCFAPTVEEAERTRAAAERTFRGTAMSFVQPTRLAATPQVACEGIGRLPKGTAGIQRLEGVVLAGMPKLLFTAAQMAFRDPSLAYERLRKTIESSGASYEDVVSSRVYGLVTTETAAQLVEGLPSLDATQAIELIVAAK